MLRKSLTTLGVFATGAATVKAGNNYQQPTNQDHRTFLTATGGSANMPKNPLEPYQGKVKEDRRRCYTFN